MLAKLAMAVLVLMLNAWLGYWLGELLDKYEQGKINRKQGIGGS